LLILKIELNLYLDFNRMKKILFLSFYYMPDLCACSFRAEAFINAFKKLNKDDVQIDIVTTMPNRYSSYNIEADKFERVDDNINIHRIYLPNHNSGFLDQSKAFIIYFFKTLKYIKKKDYDLVFATSSRLFTALLGSYISKRKSIKLYLDIRDIFVDTMEEVLKFRIAKLIILPILKSIERYTFSNVSHINLVSKGFKEYFKTKYKSNYTYHTNGIDKIFLNFDFEHSENRDIPVITYAGNIGEGQGLHIIIPEAAKALEGEFQFVIIGAGGAKQRLIDEIDRLKISNIEMIDPVNRDSLLKYYQQTDFLFFHLNKYKAFEKVLPSKLFEYAVTNKAIIGGVSGYAAKFMSKNLSDSILFEPGDVASFVKQIRAFVMPDLARDDFIQKYSRENIMKTMVREIHVDYLV